jgi:hypothetical protein
MFIYSLHLDGEDSSEHAVYLPLSMTKRLPSHTSTSHREKYHDVPFDLEASYTSSFISHRLEPKTFSLDIQKYD